MQSSPNQPPIPPSVGIFWKVGGMLAVDRTELARAEPYGDFLTHPGAHHEVWERWRRLGPQGLIAHGLPADIAWHEYEAFPRGRVVLHAPSRSYTIYADRRLQGPADVGSITRAFGLENEQWTFASDPHYRQVRDL